MHNINHTNNFDVRLCPVPSCRDLIALLCCFAGPCNSTVLNMVKCPTLLSKTLILSVMWNDQPSWPQISVTSYPFLYHVREGTSGSLRKGISNSLLSNSQSQNSYSAAAAFPNTQVVHLQLFVFQHKPSEFPIPRPSKEDSLTLTLHTLRKRNCYSWEIRSFSKTASSYHPPILHFVLIALTAT